MKKYIYAGILVLAILAMAVIAGNLNMTENVIEEAIVEDSTDELQDFSGLETVILQVDGMSCRSCALGVEFELKEVEGVADAKISYEEGIATVVYNPSKVDPETIAEASTVYPASVIK